MKKIPAVLLTGFLGAGKTTILNEILKYTGPLKLKAALLINDFGKVNIDASLVNEKYRKNIFEVNQGSIFCVCTRDQFFKALDAITGMIPPFDLLIIEATGIANTCDLNDYLREEKYLEKMEVIENICLVDAINFHKVFATLPAVKNQVQEASICVINKIDLAPASSIDIDALENEIRKLNPDAKILRTSYGKIDFADIINTESPNRWTGNAEIKKLPPVAIDTITLQSEGTININDVEDLIKGLGKKLLRAKGFIDSVDGPYYIEFIQDKLYKYPSGKNINNLNQLVLIGFEMDAKFLESVFDEITRK